MASARETIRGLLADAMRGAMHDPDPHRPNIITQEQAAGVERAKRMLLAERGPATVSRPPEHVDFPDSWIEGLDYDEDKGELTVMMPNGAYVYPDVSRDVFDEFRGAEDPGAYYNEEFHPVFHSR